MDELYLSEEKLRKKLPQSCCFSNFDQNIFCQLFSERQSCRIACMHLNFFVG